MDIPWAQIWGMGAIVVGIYWILKSEVPVGIKGQPHSFYARGKWAVVLGVVAIIIGLVVSFELPKQVNIDKCLDNGGSYDYERDECIPDKGNKSSYKRLRADPEPPPF